MPNQFKFLLQNFGLEHLKPRFYPPGTPLAPADKKSNIANTPIADSDYNMGVSQDGRPLISSLGTPVFCDLWLRYKENDEVIEDLYFDWILVDVNMEKLIVTTAVEGRDGTVKEYISDGDYMVTLRGGVSTPFSRAYPKDTVAKLVSLVKKKVALEVVSQFLFQFGITSLVVKGYNIPQMQGYQNEQPFSITCLSDSPINLRKTTRA